MGTRYECSLRNHTGSGLANFHGKGHGKPRSKTCTYCRGAWIITTGRWGIFEWRGDGRYALDLAIETFDREPAADKAAERVAIERIATNHAGGVVVRWLPESVFAPAVPADQADANTTAIDRHVETWNAALATGDPATIDATRREALGYIARQIMDDDPHYAVAGWTTVPAGEPAEPYVSGW
jgi:hypothetical protein